MERLRTGFFEHCTRGRRENPTSRSLTVSHPGQSNQRRASSNAARNGPMFPCGKRSASIFSTAGASNLAASHLCPPRERRNPKSPLPSAVTTTITSLSNPPLKGNQIRCLLSRTRVRRQPVSIPEGCCYGRDVRCATLLISHLPKAKLQRSSRFASASVESGATTQCALELRCEAAI